MVAEKNNGLSQQFSVVRSWEQVGDNAPSALSKVLTQSYSDMARVKQVQVIIMKIVHLSYWHIIFS